MFDLCSGVIGHRGGGPPFSENTISSFGGAADLGCRMVEFDVRLSADGEAVVFHDATLERCTNGKGLVRSHTLAELRRLDAGLGEPIPTLAEVLSLCLARGIGANIELKPDLGAERETAVEALRVAASLWPSAGIAPPLVSSFQPEALAAAAEIMPDWPRGLLVSQLEAGWERTAERLGCRALHAHYRGLTTARIARARGLGYWVLAYTVDRPKRARWLWERGVAGIFTNAPGLLLSELQGSNPSLY